MEPLDFGSTTVEALFPKRLSVGPERGLACSGLHGLLHPYYTSLSHD